MKITLIAKIKDWELKNDIEGNTPSEIKKRLKAFIEAIYLKIKKL